MQRIFGNNRMSPQQKKILTGCAASICGIWCSLYYVFPLHEGIGTTLAMLCSILAGIFFTRWQHARKKDRSDP